MPSYDALNDLFQLRDPTLYARALGTWLWANHRLLPRKLALDGKSIVDGKCDMIVTLCRHENDCPVAMIPANKKKEDCEVSLARALLADPQIRLKNVLITANPPHNKQATVSIIAEKGSDSLIGIKTSIPRHHQAAVAALRAPFFA